MHPKSYTDLAERLRLKVPGIKTIDLYNGQYDDPAQHNAYTCPAVFIEWLPVEWQDMPAGVQQGAGGFRIHCVVNTLRETRNIDRLSPPQQSQHTAHLLFPAAVHAALQGFAPHGYSPLGRVLTTPDHRYTGNIIVVHQYTAHVVDTSAYAYAQYIEHPIDDFEVPGEITGID